MTKQYKLPNPWPILLLLLSIIMFGLCNCSPANKAARKDAEALDRVRGSGRLQDSLKEDLLNRFPCANDTTTIILPGKPIKVPYPVPILDSGERKRVIDSIVKAYENWGDEAVAASYDAGYQNAVKTLKNKTFDTKAPDTLASSILNKQRQEADAQIINGLKNEKAGLQGVISEKEKQSALDKSEKQKWIWFFISGMIALGVTNGFWIYAKFKMPFK